MTVTVTSKGIDVWLGECATDDELELLHDLITNNSQYAIITDDGTMVSP